MKKLLILIFCVSILFISPGLSQTGAPSHAIEFRSQVSDPFSKIAGWFKRLFVKGKPTYCPVASVKDLVLDKAEIFITCTEDHSSCSNKNGLIEVLTEVSNPSTDTLIYMYKISGGKVIGEGAKVVWDLSEATPGTYTITAGVDDGCGACGRTGTKTVTVIEASK